MPEATSVERVAFQAPSYDLAATLNSGQSFRWQANGDGFEGVVGQRWVRVESCPDGVRAEAVAPVGDWLWLCEYLQTHVSLPSILADFPGDDVLNDAVQCCRGLRLLRQDPWECLASFILSSTKQIAQIRQMVACLSARYGTPIAVPPGHTAAFAFPTAERMARCTEAELRACKLGFRAAYLRGTARQVEAGRPDLEAVRSLPIETARTALMSLPGVGRKIADCVLLFAYGFPQAFPIDVWIERALRRHYFPGRTVGRAILERFVAAHFGPQAGYAQQYLYHFVRTHRASLHDNID